MKNKWILEAENKLEELLAETKEKLESIKVKIDKPHFCSNYDYVKFPNITNYYNRKMHIYVGWRCRDCKTVHMPKWIETGFRVSGGASIN